MISTYKWQDRDSLYYGQWEWSFAYRMPSAWATRELDHDKLLKRTMIGRAVIRTMEEHQWANITHHIDFMLERKESYRRCVSFNWIYLYTNSEQLVEDCRALPYISPGPLYRARVTRPKDVVLLQNPQHRFRSFLRGGMISRNHMQSMRSYLLNNSHIRVSDSLHSIWSYYDQLPGQERCWMQRYYFLDHDHAQDLTLLQMIVPGIIRCTMPIQPAPEISGSQAK